jgi:hypothetical protein
MTRPIYETQGDLLREEDVASKIGRAWKCIMIKMPAKATFDYAAKRGNVIVSLIEIKTRTNPHNQYPTYMISADKMVAGFLRSTYLAVPFMLVVQFTDGVFYWSSNQEGFTLDVGGRTDRGDTLDLEMVCHIPINHFKRLP